MKLIATNAVILILAFGAADAQRGRALEKKGVRALSPGKGGGKGSCGKGKGSSEAVSSGH